MPRVDNILSISVDPASTLRGLQTTFKLKDDKVERPDTMYLGAQLDQMFVDTSECWTMSAEKNVQASEKNVEEALSKKGLRLPTKCYTPLPTDYRPELDTSAELKSDGIQYFQELAYWDATMGGRDWTGRHLVGNLPDVNTSGNATSRTFGPSI